MNRMAEITVTALLVCMAILVVIGCAGTVIDSINERQFERRAMRECMDTGARWDDCRLWIGADMERRK